MSDEKSGVDVGQTGKIAGSRSSLLRETVYGALVMQTRLKPYLDAVTLSIDANGMLAANDDNWRRAA